MCADLWNALLEMVERRYQRGIQRHGKHVSFHCAECARMSAENNKIILCEEHKLPSEFDMGYWISEMRAEFPEWKGLSTWTPRRVATSLSAAYAAFFQRAKKGEGEAGYPRYKARRKAVAVPHRCVSGCDIIKSDRHELSWQVRAKGVPELLWARGRLPANVNNWTDADIMFRDGKWEISFACEIENRRTLPSGVKDGVTVRFDLIDALCSINGTPQTPPEFPRIQLLDDQRQAMQSAFDLKYPRGKRYSDAEWEIRNQDSNEIRKLSNKVKRKRANTLHVWSKQLVERASILTIFKPPVKELTKTPRGDEKNWGASVRDVSNINRNTLSYAPAMAMQMLEYKAKETGVWGGYVDDLAPKVAVGSDMVVVGKHLRRLGRALKKQVRDQA
jgi:transposase